jgi:hypothetical protein
MAGRLGHIDDARRVRHVPRNGIRVTNYAYGFSNAYFWLDAFTLSNLADLDPVSKWVDKFSNYQFDQGTSGNRPRFIASNASYNNYPTVNFQDTARRLTSTKPVIYNKTVCWIANINSYNVANILLASSTGTFGNVNFTGLGLGGSASGINGIYQDNGSAIIRTALVEDLNPHIVVITPSFIMVDGVVKTTTNYIPAFTFNQIGQRNTNTTEQLLGDIAEIILYNIELSQTEALLLSNNINSKYAIY